MTADSTTQTMATGRYADVNGIRLYVETHGEPREGVAVGIGRPGGVATGVTGGGSRGIGTKPGPISPTLSGATGRDSRSLSRGAGCAVSQPIPMRETPASRTPRATPTRLKIFFASISA